VVCFLSRDELRVLRGFVDEAVYGLSDSAKAFAIILFTDILRRIPQPGRLAGLGWKGLPRHFGLPSSQSFVNLFIATFPGGVGDDLQVFGFSGTSTVCLRLPSRR